jgi:hypothetical protein
VEQTRPLSSEADWAARFIVVLAVDHRLVLTNTTAMLEDLGHTALAALSGHTAIEIMRQKSADPALKHLFSARNPWIPLVRNEWGN